MSFSPQILEVVQYQECARAFSVALIKFGFPEDSLLKTADF
jgi:hypothetical protein